MIHALYKASEVLTDDVDFFLTNFILGGNTMGLLYDLFKSNRKTAEELGFSIASVSNKAHMKRLAINSCIELISKTISQVEFKVKDKNKYTKNSMYYKLNVKPNVNESATQFWQKAVYKLIYDNELLIIQNDTEDLLIADDFNVNEYAHVSNIYEHVRIGNFEYARHLNLMKSFILNIIMKMQK